MGSSKDRAKKKPRYTRIYRRQMHSEAWLHLSGSAVKTLLAIASLDYGQNNGEIHFSDRHGAKKTGLSRNTVRKSIDELLDKGFIYRTAAGGFNRKIRHAATYGLTWEAGPSGTEWRAPSHAYEKWKRFHENGNSRAQILTKPGSDSEPSLETFPKDGSNFGPEELEKRLVSNDSQMSGIGPQSVSHGVGKREGSLTIGNNEGEGREVFISSLRRNVLQHLEESETGQQTKLASSINCPAGTLSKFINGRSLPEKYVEPLAKAMIRPAKKIRALSNSDGKPVHQQKSGGQTHGQS